MPKTMRMTAVLLVVMLALGCGAYQRVRNSIVRGAVSAVASATLRIESGAPLTQSESHEIAEVAENRTPAQHATESRSTITLPDDASVAREQAVETVATPAEWTIASPLPAAAPLQVRYKLASTQIATAAVPDGRLLVRVPHIDQLAIQRLVERARREQAAAGQERHPMIVIRTCTLPIQPVRSQADDAEDADRSPEAPAEAAS
jgi:hypothetical protein